MSQFATITNRYDNEFIVPIHKAREMLQNGEINNFTEIDEDIDSTNTEAPSLSEESESRKVTVKTKA